MFIASSRNTYIKLKTQVNKAGRVCGCLQNSIGKNKEIKTQMKGDEGSDEQVVCCELVVIWSREKEEESKESLSIGWRTIDTTTQPNPWKDPPKRQTEKKPPEKNRT